MEWRNCEVHNEAVNPEEALNNLENNALKSTIEDMNAQLPCEYLYHVEIDDSWNYTVSMNKNTITFHPFIDGFDLDYFNTIIIEALWSGDEIEVEDYFYEQEPWEPESRTPVVNARLWGRLLISNKNDGIFPQTETVYARQISNFFSQMINPL